MAKNTSDSIEEYINNYLPNQVLLRLSGQTWQMPFKLFLAKLTT